MRAVRITAIGSAPELAELDLPEPTDGRLLVEVSAVALNPIDVAVASGRFYGGSPPMPYTPGSEGVGRVLEGRDQRPATRVHLSRDGLGVQRDGTLAERATVGEEFVTPIPDEVDDVTAVALGTAGVAGWLPVSWRAPVREDDRVLVLGATGTSGLVALQGARILGARRVVAAGRRPDALARAAELGADATVRLDDQADLVGAFKEACGGDGPTLIVDPLWGEPLVAAVKAAARGARVVQYGQSAGPEAALASADVRGKQLEILGYSNFAVTPEHFRRAYGELLKHAAAGRLEVDVETYPLDMIGEAWEKQVSGPGVKLIVTV